MKPARLTNSYLAWQNLKRKPLRSGCLIFIVAVFACAMFGGFVFNKSLSQGMQSLAGRLGADIMIVPYGYDKQLQVALLRGEPSSFYLKAELKEKIAAIPGVEVVSPQLFLASLDAGCCSAKVQLIGYDPNSDFVILPWMQQALTSPLQDDQVVVGSRIISGVGQQAEFFGQKFTVAARMDRTGMGFDTSVFMSMPAAHKLLLQSGILRADVSAIKEYVSSLVIKVAPGFEAKDVANAIMQSFAMEYNLDFVLSKSIIHDLGTQLKNIATFIYGLSGFLWLVAIVVLFTVFSSSLNERKRELSLLRILGASRNRLVKLIMLEAVYLSLAGAGVGLLAASAVFFSFADLIFNALGLPYVRLSALAIAGNMLLTLGVAVFVGPIASIYSALVLTKLDSYTLLREGE